MRECGNSGGRRRYRAQQGHPERGEKEKEAIAEHYCSLCGSGALTFVRYSGVHLCSRHFVAFVKKKVSRELRKQVRLPERARVAVAVSGGKDSVVTLRLLHELLSPRRGTEILAITVDEGIRSYRPPAIRLVAEHCREIGVEHRVVSFTKTFGLTLDSTKGKWGESTACTYCGVFRRYCMNREAREVGADVLATGLNLDDTAQSILMNICRGDVERLARLGPHERVQPGLVPRIQPLRQVTDKESYLYAMLRGYKVHSLTCPYAGDAMRNRFRAVVSELETASPGTRFCILNSYDAIRRALEPLYPPAKLRPCSSCGEPSAGELCEACRLVGFLKGAGGGAGEAPRKPPRRRS
ncbi:MAG: TIGR00269 family protein [Thermoplasmata archaeon]